MRIALPALVSFFLAASAPARADFAPIDLTKLTWQLKQGFEPGNEFGFETGQQGAVEILSLPISPNDIFKVPIGSGTFHYTLQTEFHLAAADLATNQVLGLALPYVGENWEVFVNGISIVSRMSLDGEGHMIKRHTQRHFQMPLPQTALRAGANMLVFHFVGDAPSTPLAGNTSLGFYQNQKYRIDLYDRIRREEARLFELGLSAMILFGAFYTLMLFLNARHDRYYLHFSLVCLFFFLYASMRLPWIHEVVQDSSISSRIEYFSVALAAGYLLRFLHTFFRKPGDFRYHPFSNIHFAASWAVALSYLILPFGYIDTVLLFWQLTVFPFALYLMFAVVHAVVQGREDAGKLIPGSLLLGVATLWDNYDSLFLFTGVRLAQSAFSIFVCSVALVVAGRTLRMRRETERLNRQLLDNEVRLRSLFEATVEALLIHTDGKVLDVNPAFEHMFGCSAKEATGRQLLDFFAPQSRSDILPQLYAANGVMHQAAGLRRDETRFFIECISKPHMYGGLAVFVTAIRDVHERKLAEEKLRERNEELELMTRSMVDRELRMVELKKENTRLLAEARKIEKKV